MHIHLETAEVVWLWIFSICCVHVCQALLLSNEVTNHYLRKKVGVPFVTLNF